MREFELTQQRMSAHYQLCTGLSEEAIKKHLLPPHDIWLSATEALNLKVCDHISELAR
jgi:ATP-dependent protease ClpP protease subunit